MKVLVRTPVTDAMLVSSSLAETEYPAWASGTSYAASTPSAVVRVIRGHRVWESAQGSNVNHDPLTDDGTWWTDQGPTNAWAMFDEVTSTASVAMASSMTLSLRPGVWVTDLALVAFSGTSARVKVYDVDDTTVIYDQTKSLPGIAAPSFFDFFFNRALVISGSILFGGMPRRRLGLIEITLYGPGMVSLGVLAMGVTHDIGRTMDGCTSDVVDHSKVEFDEFGNVSVTRRKRTKRVYYPVLMANADVPRIDALRTALSSVMCVFIGTDQVDTLQDVLLAYGLFKQFPIAVRGTSHSTYTVEVSSA